MEDPMAEVGEIHFSTSLSGWGVTFGAAALSAAVGFGFGPAMLGGLAYFWTELLLPTFSLIYIYGVALCT
jgi:hypothetical protein